jgi:proteic killer suppression protein
MVAATPDAQQFVTVECQKMIIGFKDAIAEAAFHGVNSKGLQLGTLRVTRQKLIYLNAAVELQDLRALPKYALRVHKDDRAGQHSIAINERKRICFVWTAEGATDVEIIDDRF